MKNGSYAPFKNYRQFLFPHFCWRLLYSVFSNRHNKAIPMTLPLWLRLHHENVNFYLVDSHWLKIGKLILIFSLLIRKNKTIKPSLGANRRRPPRATKFWALVLFVCLSSEKFRCQNFNIWGLIFDATKTIRRSWNWETVKTKTTVLSSGYKKCDKWSLPAPF